MGIGQRRKSNVSWSRSGKRSNGKKTRNDLKREDGSGQVNCGKEQLSLMLEKKRLQSVKSDERTSSPVSPCLSDNRQASDKRSGTSGFSGNRASISSPDRSRSIQVVFV